MPAPVPSAVRGTPPRPLGPRETTGFLLWAGALGLLLAAAGLGGVFFFTPYQQVLALGHFTYHDEVFYRLRLVLTPARYAGLQAGLAAALAVAGGALVKLRGQGSWRAVRAEMRHGQARLGAWWRRLPVPARRVGTGLLLLLLAARLWYLLRYPLGTDEIASYDYFVREGQLAILSYYPIPNNHIFYNLLAWPLAALDLPCRLVMRLPTLVVGTAGTAVGYVLLARLMGFRLATLVTGVVGLAPLGVYYAAVGRGYFVQFCLLQIGFFAMLELLRPQSAYGRLSWLAFVGSSILGLYAVPTYAYPLASLLLGGSLLARRRGRLELAGSGLIILSVAVLLYAPVIAVTGWEALVANRYVVARTAAQFWPAFRAVLYESGAEIFGPSLRLSGPAWLGAALLGGLAVGHWVPAGPRRRAGLLAWAMLLVPVLLMAGQRVYAPVRSILYLSLFGYLLLGLVLRALLLRRGVRARGLWPVLLAGVLLIGGGRLWRNEVQMRASRLETQQLERAYGWLQAHSKAPVRTTRVWMHAPLHELFFAHYARLRSGSKLTLTSGGAQGPARRYDYLVLDNYFTSTKQRIQRAYGPVYHDSLITVFAPKPGPE